MRPILLCALNDRILCPRPDCRCIFLCARLGQKLNLQFIYFPFFTFSSHKGGWHLLYCYPTAFPPNPYHRWAFCHFAGGAFLFPVISVRALRYQPLCHSCYHLAIIFKFMAAHMFLMRWEQMIIARQQIPVI